MTNNGHPVKVGVIGAGNISGQYLTNMCSFPDLAVCFIADVQTERARAQAESFRIPRWGTVDELLDDPEIEIVVNITTPNDHVTVGLAAIAAGKHVWSEKPIALDRASAQTLLAAAAQAGVRYACAPDTFLGPGLQTARAVLERNEIGTPMTALTLMQQPGPESWHPDPAFLFQAGAGPLFDVGPYYLTALVSMFGPIRRVSARASRARETRVIGSGPKRGESFSVTVPTHVAALYEFDGGGSAQCVFSFDSAIRRTLFEITGVLGSLEVCDPNVFVGNTVLHQGDSTRTIRVSGDPAARGTGVVELARAIRAGVPERASGEQAFHVLDAMIATTEASTMDEWVPVASTFTPTPVLPEGWDPRERTVR